MSGRLPRSVLDTLESALQDSFQQGYDARDDLSIETNEVVLEKISQAVSLLQEAINLLRDDSADTPTAKNISKESTPIREAYGYVITDSTTAV